MRHSVKKLLPSVAVALTVTGLSLPAPARAQTYPIDCAILLCLSGGWPASVPCARARAEFIRRITPWPVEPPLQIWRCPMGASFNGPAMSRPSDRIIDAVLGSAEPQPSLSIPDVDQALVAPNWADPESFDATWDTPVRTNYALHRAQNRADIDISGPEFDFVRSIRVFDVRSAGQWESGEHGDCNRNATVVMGSYDTQGAFSWTRSSPSALPDAHEGLERWGEHCPWISHRSVFVEWRDYSGNYGFEQINY